MKIIKTLGLLAAPLFALLGIDFAFNKAIKNGRLRFSRESQAKYEEIESEYKQKLMEWAKRKGINFNRPSRRDEGILRKEMEIVEGEILDKFADWLKHTRKVKDLKVLFAGIEMAKVFNEHLKDKF